MELLSDTDEGRACATDLLCKGRLVAFPTETVYGLGADACDDRAIARIFEAKGRPSFNPLIAHFSDVEGVKRHVHWTDDAEALAHAFWPGPLTLVLRKRENSPISRLVTAGLDTLAVRVPAHPTAKAVLGAFGGAVAAPSANLSGQISPTRAAHVTEAMADRIDAVIDAGPCSVGVESTIVGLTDRPVLLRPGGVSEDEIVAVLGGPIAIRKNVEAISAPGQMISHYAPDAAVRLNAVDWQDGEARLGFGPVECDLNLSEREDLVEAAARLFDHLHRLDSEGGRIAVSPIPHHGLGVAINDRLSRAAAPRD
ncbi:L-threonylcarbamoyladenylate synthase [Marivita sp. GX14005]|uniref:L-threonylcarbamoyladenylate synthase n=1 Tax=Marivita sp. GX14005 TaxID=2942276 RepID=UPI00201898CB|nr:L-threonylcarbamoyladenylate synthase [Marivita sp. GX14005]MCL3881477.1 L-threonylcarbamoyladenylate synthase [Marivita sp. GX14005]